MIRFNRCSLLVGFSLLTLLCSMQVSLSASFQDAPIGWRLSAITGDQWKRFINYNNLYVQGYPEEELQNLAEYCTFLERMGNEYIWLEDFNNTYPFKLFLEQSPDISASYDASNYVVVEGISIENNYTSLIWDFVKRDYGSRNILMPYLYNISKYLQDYCMHNPYFGGYHIEMEPWQYNTLHCGGDIDPADHYDLMYILQDLISDIRIRDQVNPITLYMCFQAGNFLSMLEEDSPEPNYPNTFRQLFTSDVMRGWNVFQNFHYLFTQDLNSTNNSEGYYQKHTWIRNEDQLRQLGEFIQQYADSCSQDPSYGGPDPEWWQEIQCHREWRTDNDTTISYQLETRTLPAYHLVYRRPTKYEYGYQAYSALAAGAKGIFSYYYGSTNKLHYGVETSSGNSGDIFIDDGYERNQSQSKISNYNSTGQLDEWLDNNPKYCAEGVLCYAWNVEDLDDGRSWRGEPAIDNFREPFSSEEANWDSIPSNGWENYASGENDHRYPFDDMSNVYSKLHEILPIVRNLRWWWLANCIDCSTSVNYGSYSLTIDSLRGEITRKERTFAGTTTTLSDRFHLREVYIESDTSLRNREWYSVNTSGDRNYYSPIIVGMFDAPQRDPNAEYYLFVNKYCWKKDSITDSTVDVTVPLEFDVYFEDLDPDMEYSLTRVWRSEVFFSFIDSTRGPDSTSSDYYARISLMSGNAMLLKLTSTDTETYTNYNWDCEVEGTHTFPNKVRVYSGADVSFRGNFIFEKGLEVYGTGSELTIENSTNLQFAPGESLYVHDGGRLVIAGTNHDTYLTSSALYQPNTDSLLWGGVVIEGAAGSDHIIANAVIEYAEVGIKAETVRGKAVYVRNSVIDRCTTGLYAQDSYMVTLDNSEVKNCVDGVFFLKQGTYTCYHKIRGSSIHNIEDTGVEFQGGASATLTGSKVEHCGGSGVLVYNLSSFIINGVSDSPNYPDTTLVCHNCTDGNISSDFAVYIENTSVVRFNYSQIYENNSMGLCMGDNSYLINDSKVNKINLIANNAIKATSLTQKCEIFIWSTASFNCKDGHYSIFSDEWTGDDNLITIVAPNYRTLDLSRTFWKGDVLNVTDMKNNHMHIISNPSNVGVLLDPIVIATSHHSNYWASDIDPQVFAYQHALAVLNDSLASEEAISQAVIGMKELAAGGYIPALRGYVFGRYRQNAEPLNIINELNSISLTQVQYLPIFNRSINMLNGTIYQLVGDYDEAIEIFESIADSSTDIADSLNALINREQCLRLDAIANGNKAGRHVQSIGSSTERVVALAEKRIDELRSKIFAHFSSINDEVKIPTEFALQPAYPNPFNPSVNIPFALPQNSAVKLTIYNLLGQRVTQLVNKRMEAGYHYVMWDGRSQAGLPVASGVYFVTMEAGGFVKTQKLLMVK